MSNVPMYRNTNNIAFGVSVLIVLESLFTLLYRDTVIIPIGICAGTFVSTAVGSAALVEHPVIH